MGLSYQDPCTKSISESCISQKASSDTLRHTARRRFLPQLPSKEVRAQDSTEDMVQQCTSMKISDKLDVDMWNNYGRQRL